MVSKQVSVFIENRKGRLEDILDVLSGAQVNILSMSLSDTVEYGILRILMDDPQKGKDALTAAGFSCALTDVFILKIPHVPGGLQQVLRVISRADLDVEYMYGLSIEGKEASIVVKTSDLKKAGEIFVAEGIKMLS